jgi:hypothetical protein
MASILVHFEVDDYETWKRERYDTDPAGRKTTAKRHVIFRGVEDPSQVFVSTEFDSVKAAEAFRDRLHATGAWDGIALKTPPTVVEIADFGEY